VSSAGRSAAQPVASPVPPGLNAAARSRGPPPRRKRSITRPRDHVTVWPLFRAIISLSICPNDARPIRPPPPISSPRSFLPVLPPPDRSSPPPPPRVVPRTYAYIRVSVVYLHNAPIVFHTRALYNPIMHVDARVPPPPRIRVCARVAAGEGSSSRRNLPMAVRLRPQCQIYPANGRRTALICRFRSSRR